MSEATSRRQTPESVLVVEDNEHAAYLLRALLEHAGYAVVMSPDGRDAVAKLASMEPVDLVLLDLMLPYVSGYQVLIEARLKSAVAGRTHHRRDREDARDGCRACAGDGRQRFRAQAVSAGGADGARAPRDRPAPAAERAVRW